MKRYKRKFKEKSSEKYYIASAPDGTTRAIKSRRVVNFATWQKYPQYDNQSITIFSKYNTPSFRSKEYMQYPYGVVKAYETTKEEFLKFKIPRKR